MLVDGMCSSGSTRKGSTMLCYRCCLSEDCCVIGWRALLISWWEYTRVGIIPLLRLVQQLRDGRQACLSCRAKQALLKPRRRDMHSKQQEPHSTFYVSSSQHHCFPSGDESLKMSKLDVRHFQATDRLCMPLAYLAHSYGRLSKFLPKTEKHVL